MALIVQSSLRLKVEYLSSTCSEVFTDFQRQFSCSDDAQNKIQTVGGGSGVSYGRDPRLVEIAVLSTESTILVKVRMTVSQRNRGYTSSLDRVMGIV